MHSSDAHFISMSAQFIVSLLSYVIILSRNVQFATLRCLVRNQCISINVGKKEISTFNFLHVGRCSRKNCGTMSHNTCFVYQKTTKRSHFQWLMQYDFLCIHVILFLVLSLLFLRTGNEKYASQPSVKIDVLGFGNEKSHKHA